MLRRNITIGILLFAFQYGFSQSLAYAWNPRENHFEVQKQMDRLVEPRVISLSLKETATKVPGTNMRNTGRILTFSGAALAIIGIAMVSSSDSDTYQYSSTTTSSGTYEQGDPVAALGATFAVMGTGAAVTGIILWTKGASKMKKHKSESGMEIK